MKKQVCILLCVLLLLPLFGCDQTKQTYDLLSIRKTDKAVNTKIIEDFLTNGQEKHNFQAIRKNIPDILSKLVDVTPDALKNKCSIYRFPTGEFGSLSGETLLVYENSVYNLGSDPGGFGVTEFAYINDGTQDALYFIYSWGSGIHWSHIGIFDFKTRQISDFNDKSETFCNHDITFCLSEDGKTLGICRAIILPANSDFLEFTIEKGEMLCKDITTYTFKTVK